MEILNELTRLYNQDLLCRKEQQWPLLPLKNESIDDLLNNRKPEEEKIAYCLKAAIELCEAFPDDLFFAGGFILYCMGFRENFMRNCVTTDVDFFIVGSSEKRAITIIQECVKILRKKSNNRFNVLIRSEGALTYLESTRMRGGDDRMFNSDFSEALGDFKLKFQFIHRLYSHPSQIVGMFDLFPCGVLYSSKDGFLATPLAQYCIEKKCIFVDPTRLSTTFSNRLSKYLNRGFELWIPNMVSGVISKCNSDYELHRMIKDAYSIFAYKGWVFDTRSSHWTPSPKFQEADYQERDQSTEDFIKGLYFHVPLTLNIPMVVTDDDYTVDVERLLEIHEGTENDLFPVEMSKINADFLRAVFPKEELLKVSHAIFSSDDPQREWNAIGERLSLRRQEELRKHFRPYSEGGFFKIANPGQQGGGSFNPTVRAGSDFWDGKNTFPIEVGLSHEVYWLLKQVCFNNPYGVYLPKDVFNMLCKACVIAQC